ncbi:MAG TPA: glycosyltransferase family 4 protein [Actinomycetota bacterium]|nr:glycosyltransferase family 4 protein [Actinomycetota bacterium]
MDARYPGTRAAPRQGGGPAAGGLVAGALKATFLVTAPPDRSPGQRFRAEQWLKLLPEGAVDARVLALFNEAEYHRLHRPGGTARKAVDNLVALGRRAAQVVQAQRADVVYLFREAFILGPAFFEPLLERRVPVVFDFDDAIWLLEASEANAWVARHLKVPGKVDGIIARATTTTVGNDYLADYARRSSDRVHVIPTTLDVERYCPQPREPNDLVRIGWSGSPTTSRYLGLIERPLRRALSELPVELVVTGDPGFALPGAERVRVLAWDPATEIAEVGAFDIGLMPLPDDPWSRGKCGFKALLYMSLGVTPVVSPVGVNTEIVADGESGVLADSEDQWFTALRSLVEDADLRRRLGAAGRKTVVERYSGNVWAPRFLEVLQEAASRRMGD